MRAPYDKNEVSRTVLMGCRLHIACHPSEPQSVLRPRHVQHGGRRCRAAVASLSSLTLPAPGKASDGQHRRRTPPGRQDTARASHRTLAAAEGVRPARLAAQLQAIAKTAAADTAAHPREPGIAELVTAIDAAIPHMDQALPLPIAPPGADPTAPGVAGRQTPTDPRPPRTGGNLARPGTGAAAGPRSPGSNGIQPRSNGYTVQLVAYVLCAPQGDSAVRVGWKPRL
jgi:hypothetical protein